MSYQLWSQSNFSKGELSPYMYARAETNQYYDGLKQAQNVLSYPTGAAGKRFGTLFQSILSGITNNNQIYFETFQWYDHAVFQLVFTPTNIAIYLEGMLVANVTTTLDFTAIQSLSTTTLGTGGTFRVSGNGFKPYDLVLAGDSGNVISAVNTNFLTLTTAVTQGLVLPISFTNSGGSLPTTDPQIKAGITYFAFATTTNTIVIYPTAYDAKFATNAIGITAASGSGTNTVFTYNTWNWNHTVFKNLPVYDFNGIGTSYDALTFTPNAVLGNAVTVTVSGSGYAPLDSSYIGGAFIGGGGTSRITAVASVTSFTVAVQEPFDAANTAILGSLVSLTEPAWSDARGWPQVCSSYQNRALFANTQSLPNGFYASVINDYSDFGDLTNDDDDAISWYPSSNQVNVIRYIVPFRSITVHTNTGIYSTPLSDVSVITPTTFTLQLQDSTPADVVMPQAIDNQIILLSGNDAHTMLWDGINNAYTSNIVSIVNEQTIRSPVDEAVYADLTRAGSRYVFIVNANGSLAVYQTLLSESVSGFTPQIMEQSYGIAGFVQVASSADGRAWFIVQRQYAAANAPIAITGFTSSTLTAIASNFSTTTPIAITFTTGSVLPVAIPPLAVQTYYWALGVDADTFKVYLSQEDALANANALIFITAGTSSNVVGWPLNPIWTLEELNQDVQLDCAIFFDEQGSPQSTLTTGVIFNAQNVSMLGDGFAFNAIGVNNQVTFTAHGSAVPVDIAYVGFPINLIIEPMPLSPPPGQSTTLTKPKHIRSIRFMFNNTIGGTINGQPIALKPFDQADIGEAPIPQRGIFEIGTMSGWDDFNYPSFIIEHSDPYNIELIGVFYSVDV